MATLATAYTNSRLLVPGSTSTNMPDATLLVLANQFYRVLALQDTPRVHLYNGASFGAGGTQTGGERILATDGENMARILAVIYTGTDDTTTAGTVLPIVPRPVYELERATFPGTNGTPRMVAVERISGGAWRLYVHPGMSAADHYFAIECEIEPADLTSGTSTVLLTPINFTRLEHLLAAGQARLLERDQAFIDSLLKDEVTKATFGKWLANEEGRGAMLPNTGRYA